MKIHNQVVRSRRGWMPEWLLAVFAAASLSRAEPSSLITRQTGATTNSAITSTNVPSAAVPDAQAESAALKQEAVETAQHLVAAYPKDALTYALLGSAYYNTGRSDDAAKFLHQSVDLNPKEAEAFQILARIAYGKGDLDDCIQLCRKALQQGPANPEVLNQLGRALMDQGKTEDAILPLAQAITLPHPISQSFYLLGQADLQGSHFAQAKVHFKQAIALIPDHTQAYFGLYRASLGLGEKDEAERYRAQFVKLEAIDRDALKNRSAQEDTMTGLPMVRETVAGTFFGGAQIYALHDEIPRAVELFRKASELDEANAFYRAAWEKLYIDRKDLPGGVAALAQLVRDQPQNYLNHFFLGRMCVRAGQIDAAAGAFRKVIELAPEFADGYRALADLYLRANRESAEAKKAAEQLVKLEPTGPHYYMLAVACLRTQDQAGALAAIRRAAELAPNVKAFRDMQQQLERGAK